MKICTKFTICVPKKPSNCQTSGSSILKDMGIFVFICIYRQIQKYPYLLKYLSQRSEILCASLPHKVRTLSQFWTIFDLFGSMKLLFNDPHNWPTVPPPLWEISKVSPFFSVQLPLPLAQSIFFYPHIPPMVRRFGSRFLI